MHVVISAVALEQHMVLKYKLCFILQKSLQIYESIIFDISLSETKFLIVEKHNKVLRNSRTLVC